VDPTGWPPGRLLGLRERPAQPVQLGLLVDRHAERRLAWRIREPLAGPPDLLHRIRPGAPQLHHLGPVHQALPAEGHQVRLRRTPVAQRRRPLLCAAQIKQLLAGLDHGAVDAPDHDRRHLAGLDGDHRLVQQRHALGGLPQPQQRLASASPGKRGQVAVAEAVADLGGQPEGGVRGRGVALGKALQRQRYEQIPLLHAVQLAVVQQPPGPGKPAATAGQLAPVQQAEGQPERAPGGTLRAAQPQPLPMRARQDLVAVGIPTHQVGGLGQQLQILRGKRGLPVGRRQLVEGIRPRLPLQGGPAPIQCVSRGHAPSPPADTRTQVARRTPAPYRLLLTGRRRQLGQPAVVHPRR